MTTEAGSQLVLLTWIKCINDMKSTQRASFSLQEATDFAQKYKISKQALTAFLLFMKQVITSFKCSYILLQILAHMNSINNFFFFSLFTFCLSFNYSAIIFLQMCLLLWFDEPGLRGTVILDPLAVFINPASRLICKLKPTPNDPTCHMSDMHR